MGLADPLLAEGVQVVLESAFELLGERPFLRDLGGTDIQYLVDSLFDQSIL